MSDGEVPADERVPCADGMCTGIVGADGRCGTCGAQGEAGAVAEETFAPTSTSEAREESSSVDGGDQALSDEGMDTYERVPCVDEMCTGIVGANGCCGTCGRAA